MKIEKIFFLAMGVLVVMLITISLLSFQSIAVTKSFIVWGSLFSGLTVVVLIIISRRYLFKKTQLQKELLIAKDKAENSVKELNKAQRIAHVGSWLLDPVSQRRHWSDEMFYIWGLHLKKGSLDNDSLFNLVHQDDLELFKSTMDKAVNLGTPFDIEFRICSPNNKQKTLRSICKPVFGDLFEVVSLEGTTQDITERKKSKELLKENKDQLSLIYNNTIDSIWLISLEVTEEKIDFRFIYINDAFISTTGFSRQNVEGKLLEEVLPKASHELVRSKYIEAYNKGETIHYSEVSQLPAGERYGEIRIVPVKDATGKITKLHCSAHDITENQIAKDKTTRALADKELLLTELEESENRLNIAQNTTKIGSWEFNTQTFDLTWSLEHYRIFELENTPPEKLFEEYRKKIHPDDIKELDRLANKAMEYGIGYTFPHRVLCNDGSIKEVLGIAHPIVDENGKTIAIHGTCQDISSQVKLQRLKAVGEMSSSIAHDFNNSLQQMMGNLEIVKLQKNMPDKALEGLRNIGSIIRDVAGRVSALQKFGDTEHVDKNTQLIDFNALIKESINQSRPLWKDATEKEGLNITVTTDFEDIPKIKCNSGDLKLAVYNLIKNSIEAMPNGGEIIIKTGTKAKQIYATFTDTGVGMDEETKLKIFQPFYSTKGFELGRGLGMSGVYTTVKKYKGDIVIKSSELGKGTSIEMNFPIVQQNEIKVTNEHKSKAKGVFSVLWVDDDTIITENISELVELLGHKCSISNSGKNALDYLSKNTCDIVFTDIGMPEMNGWELIAAIKNDFGSKIKIVTVTGWDIDEKTRKEHAIDFVLQKPFTVEKLEELFLQL
jgi:PAS domain S-box-containing protein